MNRKLTGERSLAAFFEELKNRRERRRARVSPEPDGTAESKRQSGEKKNNLHINEAGAGNRSAAQKDENTVASALSKAIPTVISLLFSFTVSAATPAMGVYPFGIALVAASGTFSTAAASLVGVLAASLRMGKNAAASSIFVSCALFALRLAAGGLGIVKTRPLPISKKSGSLPDFQNAYGFSGATRDAACVMKMAFSTEVAPKIWFALAAAVTVGIVGIFTGTNLWYDVFACVFGIVLVPLFTFAFSAVSERGLAPSVRKAGVFAAAYALFLALSPLAVGGMNVAVVLAFLASLYVGSAAGCSDGALFGLFCGMAQTPAFCAMYAVGAIACGALSSFSAGVAAVTSAVLAVSWALYADGIAAFSSVMPEILLASAIFYPLMSFKVLPEKISIIPYADGVLPSEEQIASHKRSGSSDRMKRISDAMSHMAKIFEGLSERLRLPGAAETFSICEEAFSVACIDCPKKNICHARESFNDGGVVRDVSRALRDEGRVSIRAFPESMRRGCSEIDNIAREINSEYRKFFESAVRSDKTSVIAKDYEEMATLIRESVVESDEEWEKNPVLTEKVASALEKSGISFEAVSVYGKRRPQIFVRGLTVKDLSYGTRDLLKICEKAAGVSLTEPEMSIDYDKLNMFMECRKRFCVSHGRCSERASYPEVNGDVITTFKGERGEMCMLICDGMGSGREAALTARVASVFLEKMLGAGCPVDTALELLNNFTRERRIECFSTVDLLRIDPFSGVASFVKSGAAPSFVLRRGKVFKIESDTAPVGILKDVSAKAASFELEAGDVIIMLSDGVIPEDESSLWLYDMMAGRGVSGASPDESARRIVEEAKKHCRRPDDATVGILKIDAA